MSNESKASSSHQVVSESYKICRICLKTKTENFIDILLTDDLHLAQHVFEYFKVEVKDNDGKSTKLCSECMEHIDIWRGHIQQANNSQLVVTFLDLQKQLSEEQPKNHNNQTASMSNDEIESVSSANNMIESTSDHMIECTSTSIEPSMSNCNTILECNANLSIQKELQLPGKDTKAHRYHTRSSTSKLVKNICPFCIHKPPQVAHSYNIIFCVKHAHPYTCLVPECYTVFPNKTVFLPHYRSHLQLDRSTYLCRKCFVVLGCSKRPTKGGHDHQKLSALFNCCSKSFIEMNDFVLHKLHYHPSKIVMAGDKKGQTVMMQNSVKIEEVKKEESTVVSIVDKNQHLRGEIVCITCHSYFNCLITFIKHRKMVHDHNIYPKESDIKLCPLCNTNFHCNKFIEHMELCINTMRVGKKELNRFWCVYCKNFFTNISAYKFRIHVIYCQTFETIFVNNVQYKKCIFCTFTSVEYAHCLSHANIFCMQFQLNQKYAKRSTEKKEVIDRMFHVDNPVESTLEVSSSGQCDPKRQLLLLNDYYNYICINCNKCFFDKTVFLYHINDDTLRICRDPEAIYCPMCVTDFRNEKEYNRHFSGNDQLVPASTALSTLLIKEEDNSNSSNADDIYCPLIVSCSDVKVFGNSFIQEQEIASTSTDFQEHELLEPEVFIGSSYTYEEINEDNQNMYYMHCEVEEKPII